MTKYAQIVGWGKALPTRVMHNREFEGLVETSDQWIRERTGIVERRLAGPGETTGTLAAQAAREALAVADLDPRRVDFVIVATCTPDKLMPATAPMVQQAIGATNAAAVDVNAACAGFTYALVMANSMIAAGMYRHVLVIGADTLARWLDWEDRRVSILFGDGAGAVLLAASDEPTGLLAYQLGSDGSKADLLHIPAGGSAAPSTAETVAAKGHFIQMEGRAVFKFAVRAIVDSTRAVLDAAGAAGRRRRPLRPPPGQRAHHRRGRAGGRPAEGARLHERRALRQHVGRLDPDRALRGDRERRAAAGRQRADVRLRRRPDLGHRPLPVGRAGDRAGDAALAQPGLEA